MKRFLPWAAALLWMMSVVSASGASLSPVEVVDKRMRAYNEHDLEAFLDLYADDVRIYTYPEQLLTAGKAGLSSIFEPLFEAGQVTVIIHSQIEKDGYVINHETVDYGNEKIEYVSIYEVRGGLITSVRFVRD